MPDDNPQNEMDKTLRAYAEKRRDNPEVRIHPATRRMLQGEVKRTYPETSQNPGWSPSAWWRNFWPYLAVLAVLGFIVVELVITSRPPKTEMTVASNDRENVTEEPQTENLAGSSTDERRDLNYFSSDARTPASPAGRVDTLAEAGKALPSPELAEPAVPAFEPQPKPEAKAELEIARSVSPPAQLETTPLPPAETTQTLSLAANIQSQLYRQESAAERQLADQAIQPVPEAESKASGNELLTTAPPVQTSSAVQPQVASTTPEPQDTPSAAQPQVAQTPTNPPDTAVSTTVATKAAQDDPVLLQRFSRVQEDRLATNEPSAQELAQRAWEARMRALAPPPENLAKRQATSAPVAVAAAPTVSTSAPQTKVAARRPVEVEELPPIKTETLPPERTVALATPSTVPARPASQPAAQPEAGGTQPTPSVAPIRLAPGEQLQLTIDVMAGLTNLGAAQRTWFMQATNPAAQVPAAILPNFHVERLGEDVRFVDADGSVYLGKISRNGLPPQFEPVTGRALGEFDGARTAPRFAPLDVLPDDLVITNAAIYEFAVEGTNLSLGVPVTLRGKYVQRTNSPSMRGIAGVAAPAGSPEPAGAVGRQGLPRSKAAIVGAAVIGGTNTIIFKALAPGE